MLVKRERENFYILNFLDEFMIGHNGFICGGCFKNIFNKQKVKDIDIFFQNKNDFADAVAYFDSMTPGYVGDEKRSEEYTFYYENDNVKAYKHNRTGIVVELCCKVYGTVKQILERFDFSITKFAYFKEEVPDEIPFEEPQKNEKVSTHIEYKILIDDKFFEHLHLKRLVVDDKIPFPMSTFERMIRYIKYGFMPCKETKIKIASAIQQLTPKEIVTGKSLYDGMD